MKMTLPFLLATTLVSASPSTFEDVFRELAPPEGEAWRTIPWETELLAAQALAAESGKPLFIWAMDGHPLGCT